MKIQYLLLAALSFVSLLSVTVIYTTKLAFPPIRSDGIGYYSYLPSIFIHQSLNFEDLVVERFEEEPLEKMPEYGQLRTAQNGSLIPEFWTGLRFNSETQKYVNQYPFGEAIMILPFFLSAHVLSLALGINMDGGFGPMYQLAGGFAGIFYFLCGIFIAYKVLIQKFSLKVTYIALVALIFGTNLFHYATYDSSFSHVYSFFLITLLVANISWWYKSPSYKKSFLLALNYALIFLVRPTNAISLMLFVLYDIQKFKDVSVKLSLFRQNYKYIITTLIVGLVCILPLFMYYKYAFNDFLVIPYREFEGFNLTSPQVLNSLFSVRKGLFFWSLVLILSVFGVFKMKKFTEYRLAIVVSLVIATWIITSWWHWPYGGSFGHRAYIDWFILFLLPLAELINWASSKKFVRIFMYSFIILAIALTTKLMIQYWLGVIEIDGTTLKYYLDNFFTFEYRR